MEIPVMLTYWSLYPLETQIGVFTGVDEKGIEDIMRCVSKALTKKYDKKINLYKNTVERYLSEIEADALSEKQRTTAVSSGYSGKSYSIELRFLDRNPSNETLYGISGCLENCTGFLSKPVEF